MSSELRGSLMQASTDAGVSYPDHELGLMLSKGIEIAQQWQADGAKAPFIRGSVVQETLDRSVERRLHGIKHLHDLSPETAGTDDHDVHRLMVTEAGRSVSLASAARNKDRNLTVTVELSPCGQVLQRCLR